MEKTTAGEVCVDAGDVKSVVRDYSFGLTPNQLHRMGYYAPGEQVAMAAPLDGAIGTDDWREGLKGVSALGYGDMYEDMEGAEDLSGNSSNWN